MSQWAEDFRDWHATGERLAKQEESAWPNSAPDPDDYAAYDDEAARLVIVAASLLGVTV
jgi:hypothetical protein